jgi:hypothetical protein
LRRKGILLLLGLAGLIVLAACSSAGSSLATQEVSSAEPMQTGVVAMVEDTPTVPPTVEAAIQPSAIEPTAAEQAEVIEVRVGLAASTPADFQVASGEVQLVEFFAFW